MANIEVMKGVESKFHVTVHDYKTTEHTVTLTNEYYAEISKGKISEEHLIRSAFEFLLERESNASILQVFALPVIGTYFPEFEKVMRGKIAEG